MTTPEWNEIREKLSDPALTALRDRHFDRLRALHDGSKSTGPLYLNGYSAGFVREVRNGRAVTLADPLCGLAGPASPNPYTEPEAWVAAAAVELADIVDATEDEKVFRPLCIEFGPYGVHFVDRIFGAEVYTDDADGWQVAPLHTPVGTLSRPDLEHDETWLHARRVALAFTDLDVSLPLFGMPTVASALNIGINLFGQDLLLALLTDSTAAAHDLAVINDVLCRIHRWYTAHVPARQLQSVIAAWRCRPPGHGQLCGCSTHLVSAETYRDCVAPLDAALLAVHPHGGMIHLCGAHTQHIPTWRRMKSLKTVQLNDRAAEDVAAYYHGLRDDQVLYVNPCPGMPLAEIRRITRGRRVVIVGEEGKDS